MAHEKELRIDPADGEPYLLTDFIDEYGGTVTSPPQEWVKASVATQASSQQSAPAGEEDALRGKAAGKCDDSGPVSPADITFEGNNPPGESPLYNSSATMPASGGRVRAQPTVGEQAAVDNTARQVAQRLKMDSGGFEGAIAAAEDDLHAEGMPASPWESMDHPFHQFYRFCIHRHVKQMVEQGSPSHARRNSSDEGSQLSSQPLRNRPPRPAGEDNSLPQESVNPLANFPGGPRPAGAGAAAQQGPSDPFGHEKLSLEAIRQLKEEREREYAALDAARLALVDVQRGALPLTSDEARDAEERYAQAASAERMRNGRFARLAQRRDNRETRRWEQVRQELLELYEGQSMSQLVLCAVRVQCWWRGTRVRLLQARLRKKGMQFNWSDRRAYEVVSTTFHLQPAVPWDLPASVRNMPVGPYGAWKSFKGDTTSTRVSWRRVLCTYAVAGGRKRKTCGLCCLGFLCLWAAAVGFALYALFGVCTIGLGTIYLEGHNSLDVDQIVVFYTMFAAIIAAALLVLHIGLVFQQESFAWNLDLTLSIVAAKHKALISLQQQQALRGSDLFSVKRVFFWDLPYCVVYFIIWFLSLGTVFSKDNTLGFINMCYGGLLITFTLLYDRFVLTQAKIMKAVVAHEAAEYRRALRVASEGDVPNMQSMPRRFSDRDYKIAVMKALSRMMQSFGRIHAFVATTVLMSSVVSVVLFWYAGYRMMNDLTPRMLPSEFMTSFVYATLSQISLWLFGRHLSAIFLCRPAVTRVFRIAWHFREATEESAFVEKHCQIVAKTAKLKASRPQPPSRDLVVCNVTFFILIIAWLAFVAGFDVGMECKSRNVDCYQVRTGDRAQRKVGQVSMPYSFSFFEGCVPLNPVASTLRNCGVKIIRDGLLRQPAGSEFSLSIGDTFTTQVWYKTWRNTWRGIEKELTVNASSGRAAVCPTIDLYKKPFLDVDQMPDHAASRLGTGEGIGMEFTSVPEIFFREAGKPSLLPYQGCYPERPLPKGVCDIDRNNPDFGLQICWCDQGRPRPLDVSGKPDTPCTCQLQPYIPGNVTTASCKMV
eukprot:Hpha_TRINITY_DN16396_c1_g4::TRINITY_DN16396_c1_g4_i1::g.61007::m.61007